MPRPHWPGAILAVLVGVGIGVTVQQLEASSLTSLPASTEPQLENAIDPSPDVGDLDRLARLRAIRVQAEAFVAGTRPLTSTQRAQWRARVDQLAALETAVRSDDRAHAELKAARTALDRNGVLRELRAAAFGPPEPVLQHEN